MKTLYVLFAAIIINLSSFVSAQNITFGVILGNGTTPHIYTILSEPKYSGHSSSSFEANTNIWQESDPFKVFERRWDTHKAGLTKSSETRLKSIQTNGSRLFQNSKNTLSKIDRTQSKIDSLFLAQNSLPLAGSSPNTTSKLTALNKQIAQAKIHAGLNYATQSELLLNNMDVRQRLTSDAFDYVSDRINTSKYILNEVASVPENEWLNGGLKQVVDLAYSQLEDTFYFLRGLASGVSKFVIDTAEATLALASTPDKIVGLVFDLISGNNRGAAFADKIWTEVKSSLYQALYELNYGPPEKKGEALGNLGANLIFGMTTSGGSTLTKTTQLGSSLTRTTISKEIAEKTLVTLEAKAPEFFGTLKSGAEGIAKAESLRLGFAAGLKGPESASVMAMADLFPKLEIPQIKELFEYGAKNKLTAAHELHLAYFLQEGRVSFFVTEDKFFDFILNTNSPWLGREDGWQFVTQSSFADKVVSRAGANLDRWNKLLGSTWEFLDTSTQLKIYRIDLKFSFDDLPRAPSGFERGANVHYKFGGYTPGGTPEIVVFKAPKSRLLTRPEELKPIVTINKGN